MTAIPTLETLLPENTPPEVVTAIRYLNLAVGIVAEGSAGAVKLQALNAKIEEMVAEGREPTADEWAALGDRSDEASARIQAAADRRRAEAEADKAARKAARDAAKAAAAGQGESG